MANMWKGVVSYFAQVTAEPFRQNNDITTAFTTADQRRVTQLGIIQSTTY